MAGCLGSTAKSVLLLGPRQTGKSTLVRSLQPDLVVNLAFEQVFLGYSSQPGLLEKVLEKERPRSVFIDEVQRLPSLLNTVQGLLDDVPGAPRFYLTGSSARKLRRGNVNLLPGRVVQFQLGPLLAEEMGDDLRLEDALAYGTLPGIVTERDTASRRDVLRTYASTYLKEEIQAEALTRNIEGFSRFLFVAASKSGQFLDYAKLGSQASITQKTSTRFFEILEDTLIATRLDTFASDDTRRLVRHPKFYFFDNGVLNGLLRNFTVSDDRRGSLFEHFIVNQVLTANRVLGEPARLSTYRTEAGSEVDLVIEKDGDTLAVEIKAGTQVGGGDLSGLRRFAARGPRQRLRAMVVYAGTRAYRDESVDVLPWRVALEEVGALLSD